MTSALIGTARMFRGPAWRRIRTGKGRAARAGEAGGDARKAALADLEGDGVATLRQRVSA